MPARTVPLPTERHRNALPTSRDARLELLAPSQLTAEHQHIWAKMQHARVGYDSPFLHPDYLRLLERHGRRIEIAILEQAGCIGGFFPFERNGRRAWAPGGRLCDVQAMLSSPDVEWPALHLLRDCGLRVWHFHHLLASQPGFQRFHLSTSASHYLDLSNGYQAYLAERAQAGTSQIQKTARKRRKMEQDIGRVRFEWNTTDRAVFEHLLKWKRQQRRRTRTFDVLQLDWVVRMLDDLRTSQTTDFEGVLSVLHVGNEYAAIHLGMRAGQVFHHWFPAFNRRFSKYSPGLVLLLDMSAEAARRGITRIDIGSGDVEWKRCFASDAFITAAGAADVVTARHTARATWVRFCEWVKRSPFHGPLQTPKRLLRRWQSGMVMR